MFSLIVVSSRAPQKIVVIKNNNAVSLMFKLKGIIENMYKDNTVIAKLEGQLIQPVAYETGKGDFY